MDLRGREIKKDLFGNKVVTGDILLVSYFVDYWSGRSGSYLSAAIFDSSTYAQEYYYNKFTFLIMGGYSDWEIDSSADNKFYSADVRQIIKVSDTLKERILKAKQSNYTWTHGHDMVGKKLSVGDFICWVTQEGIRYGNIRKITPKSIWADSIIKGKRMRVGITRSVVVLDDVKVSPEIFNKILSVKSSLAKSLT